MLVPVSVHQHLYPSGRSVQLKAGERMPWRWGVASGILVGLLVWQVVARPWQGELPRVGPSLGQPLPLDVRVSLAADGSVSSLRQVMSGEGHRCALLVAISTYCFFCQRMRYTWRSRYADWQKTVGHPVKAVWISLQDSATLAAFSADALLDEVTLVRTDDFSTFEGLGVIGTPTTYLVDQVGRLRIGVAGDQLPPVDSGRTACAS